MTTIYEPVIAVLDSDEIAHLRPTVDRLAESLSRTLSDSQLVQMDRCGWTVTMLAWGRLLAALAEFDLDVVGRSEAS